MYIYIYIYIEREREVIFFCLNFLNELLFSSGLAQGMSNTGTHPNTGGACHMS